MNATAWQTRIVGTGEEAPTELNPNPGNWRRHPELQRQALGDALDRVGWVTQVVVNRTTGNLVDGHLRVEMAEARGEATVPVTYVELSETEERTVLATLDPIGALADADNDALDALLVDLDLGDTLEGILAHGGANGTGEHLQAMDVSLAEPRHHVETGEVWEVGRSLLVVDSIYDGWATFGPLLTGKRLLVPYPSPIVPLTERGRKRELVMVQPDPWLAGHLLDKHAEVYGEDSVKRVD